MVRITTWCYRMAKLESVELDKCLFEGQVVISDKGKELIEKS